MRILFITRKYPPSIGGMQRLSYFLTTEMSKRTNCYLIKWGRSQAFLPFFLLYAFMKGLWTLQKKQIHIVHLGDPVLAPIGLFLRRIHQVPIVVSVHGLDIIYPNRLYQKIIPKILLKMDKLICISEKTKEECVKRGIPSELCIVIPVGVKATDKDMEYPKIDEEFFANFKNKKILFSVGRLVERKGFAWFIQNVMPSIVKFEEDICYVIVGDGPLRGKLVRLIKALGLHDYIFLLGNIDDKKLRALYLLSHVFVMPNIQVPGDMEGFGIVALEASSMGLCTVASRLEGITDAIKHGRNGFLVEPENRNEFITTLMGLLRDSRTRKALGEKFRDFTLANYSWDRIINRYTTLFEQIVNDHKNTLNHARPQNQERID